MKNVLCVLILLNNINIIINISIPIPHNDYTEQTEYFIELVQVYSQYERIYHIDSKSKDVFERTVLLFRKSKTRIPFAVYNYDTINSTLFKRPENPKLLHIIYTTNPKYWQIFAKPYQISHKDVVFFISTNQSHKDLYKNAEVIKLSGNVILIELLNTSTSGIFLYQICHYCGNLSRQFLPIHSNESSKFLPHNFRNLNGHKLNLVFLQNFPFIYCEKSQNDLYQNVCINLGGIESHMIRLISRKMNFEFKAYYKDVYNSSFLEMLRSVNLQKYDLAFGSISMTLERRKLIQFTISYNLETYNLLYKVSLSFVEVLKKFFDPFSDIMVWILFLSTQILLVILLMIIQKLERRKKRKKTLIECFWLLLQIQMEQSIPSKSSPHSSTTTKNPKNFSKYSSTLLLLWCFTCLVLCSAYKGVTLSTLLHPPKTEPEGLTDLLKRGYGIAGNYKSRDIIMDLMYGLPYMPNIYFGPTNCEVFSQVQHTKTAMVNEWSILQFQLKKYCPKPDPKIEEWMRVCPKAVRAAGHAWATQQGAPYNSALDHYLSLILSGGLYVKWTRDHTYSETEGIRPFRLSRESQKHMRAFSLPLYAFYPLIIIYFFGIFLALIVFTFEMFYFYIYRARKQ